MFLWLNKPTTADLKFQNAKSHSKYGVWIKEKKIIIVFIFRYQFPSRIFQVIRDTDPQLRGHRIDSIYGVICPRARYQISIKPQPDPNKCLILQAEVITIYTRAVYIARKT